MLLFSSYIEFIIDNKGVEVMEFKNVNRIIYFIVCFVSVFSVVIAKDENKLYFTDRNDRLYYDSTLYDEDLFISNLDMVPGREYKDELLIKNQSNVKYRLYLKINDIEENPEARELLENIHMTITIDGESIYNGTAHGLTYKKSANGYSLDYVEPEQNTPVKPNNNQPDLTNAIHVGDYPAYKTSKMVVITKLDENYSNPNGTDISRVEWGFVAEYGDKILPLNPDTGIGFKFNIYYLIIILLIILVITYLIVKKIKENKTKEYSKTKGVSKKNVISNKKNTKNSSSKTKVSSTAKKGSKTKKKS